MNKEYSLEDTLKELMETMPLVSNNKMKTIEEWNKILRDRKIDFQCYSTPDDDRIWIIPCETHNKPIKLVFIDS